MKRVLQSIAVAIFVMSVSQWSCGQQGPTQPTAVLVWTQAVPTATSGPVTANCVYRGTTSGNYTLPALFCSSAPITTYTDTTVVAGSTYHYAVTAHFGIPEGPYSNDGVYTVPVMSAPTLSTIVQ